MAAPSLPAPVPRRRRSPKIGAASAHSTDARPSDAVGQHGERRVNLGQRVFGAAKGSGIRDQDLSCDQVVRFPFDLTGGRRRRRRRSDRHPRPRSRPGSPGRRVSGPCGHCPRPAPRPVRRNGRRRPSGSCGSRFGQREPRLGRVGVVVGQPLIGAERGVLGAAGHLDGGKLRQRLAMGRLVFEDVSELQVPPQPYRPW